MREEELARLYHIPIPSQTDVKPSVPLRELCKEFLSIKQQDNERRARAILRSLSRSCWKARVVRLPMSGVIPFDMAHAEPDGV
jgi:hypothetical protein